MKNRCEFQHLLIAALLVFIRQTVAMLITPHGSVTLTTVLTAVLPNSAKTFDFHKEFRMSEERVRWLTQAAG